MADDSHSEDTFSFGELPAFLKKKPESEKGARIPTTLRIAGSVVVLSLVGGVVFMCLVGAFVGELAFSGVSNRLALIAGLLLTGLLLTLGYCGLVIARNTNWPNRTVRREGKVQGVCLLLDAFIIQLAPAFLLAIAFLVEIEPLANFAIGSLVVLTGPVGLWKCIHGFVAVVTGFAPSKTALRIVDRWLNS